MTLVERVFRFMQHEYHVTYDGLMPRTSEWKLSSQTEGIARQIDGYECAVFISMYALCTLMKCNIDRFGAQELIAFRRHMVLSLLEGRLTIDWDD